MIIQIVADSPISDLSHLDRSQPIICTDGAIYRLLDDNIKVKYLIGDLDAVDEAVLIKAKEQGVNILKIEDQNSNDLGKGIKLAIELGASTINIFQAVGGRIDQTLCNIGLLKKFHEVGPELRIINGDETMLYLEDIDIKLYGNSGMDVAIMSFPRAIVTSNGLEYDMDKLELKLGGIQSSSNKLKAQVADISVVGAALLIHHKDIIYTPLEK
jgi:thiamine pyrophosphokinase